MNKIIIPVLASVLILGVLGTAEDAFAPKKIFVGGLSWDATTQEFVVTVEMNRGMAKAIEKADFVLDTNLHISLPGGTLLILETQGVKGFVDPIDPGGHVIANVNIPWDRLSGIFEGPAFVNVVIDIQNPGGKSVAVVDPFTDTLDIGPPDCEAGDFDLDGVCDDVDICLGHNDNVDTDGDGIPDGCDDDTPPRPVSNLLTCFDSSRGVLLQICTEFSCIDRLNLIFKCREQFGIDADPVMCEENHPICSQTD